MTSSLRTARVLQAAAWGLLAAGTALAVWPARARAPALPPESYAMPGARRDAAKGDAGARDAIVRGNLFTASRSAPATRWAAGAPSAPPSGVPVARDATGGETIPAFYGTVIGTDGAAALLRLDPAQPGAQLYREGDRAGRYRVVRIAADRVTLDGPRGRVELILTKPEGS